MVATDASWYTKNRYIKIFPNKEQFLRMFDKKRFKCTALTLLGSEWLNDYMYMYHDAEGFDERNFFVWYGV